MKKLVSIIATLLLVFSACTKENVPVIQTNPETEEAERELEKIRIKEEFEKSIANLPLSEYSNALTTDPIEPIPLLIEDMSLTDTLYINLGEITKAGNTPVCFDARGPGYLTPIWVNTDVYWGCPVDARRGKILHIEFEFTCPDKYAWPASTFVVKYLGYTVIWPDFLYNFYLYNTAAPLSLHERVIMGGYFNCLNTYPKMRMEIDVTITDKITGILLCMFRFYIQILDS